MTTTSPSAAASAPPRPQPQVAALLTAAAVAMVLTHWLRLLPLGFSAPGATRYEDFVDLLTPYVVAGPCLAALARCAAPARTWAVVLTATGLFVQGHGLHLAANSISHARGPAAPTYLWDEQIGHALWFAGLALLAGVVLTVVSPTGAPAVPGARAYALSALVGFTWAANAVEAGTVVLGATATLALAALGAPRRDRRVVLLGCATVAVALAVYGVWQGGFPQPSELGWL